MAEQISTEEQSNRIAFSPPYDREREKHVEDKLVMVIQGIYNYYAEYHYEFIDSNINADTLAVIKGTLQDMKILLLKSKEKPLYDQIVEYEEEIRKIHQLPTLATSKKLENLMAEFVEIMARHNFKDRTQPKKQPWEQKLKND